MIAFCYLILAENPKLLKDWTNGVGASFAATEIPLILIASTSSFLRFSYMYLTMPHETTKQNTSTSTMISAILSPFLRASHLEVSFNSTHVPFMS